MKQITIFLLIAISLSSFAQEVSTMNRREVDPYLNCISGEVTGEYTYNATAKKIQIVIARSTSYFSSDTYLILSFGGRGVLGDINEDNHKVMNVSVTERDSNIVEYSNKREKVKFFSPTANPGSGIDSSLLILNGKEINMICTYPVIEEGSHSSLMRVLIDYKNQ